MLYSRIIERVRANSGWSSPSDLTAARIGEAVNYIYTRKIPHKLNWKGLQEWGYIRLADGDAGFYGFATAVYSAETGGNLYAGRVRSMDPPFLLKIDSNNTLPLKWTRDREGFWKLYPPYTNEDDNQPEMVLLDKKGLFARPIPDASYTIQAMCNLRPTALAANDDTPVEDWSEAIIAGATAILAEDDEEEDDATLWWGIFNDRLFTEIEDEHTHPEGRVNPNW